MKLRLYGPNILGNPGFERANTSSWGLYANAASYAQAAMSVSTAALYAGNYSLFVDITSGGAGVSDIQVYQQNVVLPGGVPVSMQYAAKGVAARPLRINYLLGMSPWTLYYWSVDSLSTDWQLFEHTFTLAVDVNSGSARFYAGSNNNIVDFYLDETSVRNYVELPVTYGYERADMLTRHDARGATGELRTYIEPNAYGRFSLPLTNVTSMVRSLINSWWQTGSELRLVEDATYPFSFRAVRIVGAEEPLTRFTRPYNNEYEGELVLETV